MSNNKIEQKFYKVVRELEKVFGSGMKTNFNLIDIASKVCPEIGIGQNVIKNMDYHFKKMRGKYAIVNTNNDSGEHWLSVYQKGKTIYVFDSFGRPTKSLVPEFYNRAVNAGFRVVDTEYDA